MHVEIKSQKLLLELAINWINMGENCEMAIKGDCPDKEWWKAKKNECAEQYADCIENLLKKFINIDDLLIAEEHE